MVKKPVKKSLFSQMQSFSGFDRVFDNFRRDMEKSFFTLPGLFWA
jgi:hypothetical protein